MYPRTNGNPGNPFYRFIKALQPTPGANDKAFLPAFGLPAYWIVGPGIVPRESFRLTSEQTYWTHDTIAAGLQGVVAGQLALQHLVDPRFGAYGGPAP